MELDWLEAILSDEDDEERNEAAAKLLEFCLNAENIPKIFEVLGILAMVEKFSELSVLLIAFRPLFTLQIDFTTDQLQYILERSFDILFKTEEKYARFFYPIIDIIIQRYRTGLITHIKNAANFLIQSDYVFKDTAMSFIARYAPEIIDTNVLPEDTIDLLCEEIFTPIAEHLNSEHSEIFEIHVLQLVTSLFSKSESFIPIMGEVAEKILENDKNFQYILKNDMIDNWVSIDIWELLKKYQNHENQFYRMKAIKALCAFLDYESTEEDARNIISDLVYDLTLKEFEDVDECQFEFHSNPDEKTDSVRGAIVELLMHLNGETKQIDENHFMINGIKLYFNDNEAESFAYYVLMKCNKAELIDIEWLSQNINPTSLNLISKLDFDLSLRISHEYLESDDKSLAICANIIAKTQKQDKFDQIIQKFEKHISDAPEFAIMGDALDDILAEAIEYVKKEENLPKEKITNILDKSAYLMFKYNENYCEGSLMLLFTTAAEKIDKIPFDIMKKLVDAVIETLNARIMIDSDVFLLLAKLLEKVSEIPKLFFDLVMKIERIFTKYQPYSLSPFILLSALIQREVDIGSIIQDFIFEGLQNAKEDFDVGCYILVASTIVISCDGDLLFDFCEAMDKWISKPDCCKYSRLLKYSAKALKLLASERKDKRFEEAANIVLATEPDDELNDEIEVVLPYDK